MGFFSKKSSAQESELEEMYVNMYVSVKGLSPSEARKITRTLIQQAKEEAQREGTADLPQNFGDELLAIESTDEKVKAMFSIESGLEKEITVGRPRVEAMDRENI